MSNINPLLQAYDLPPFRTVKPEHVLPAVEAVLAENRQLIAKITAENNVYTWENLILPLEEADDKLHRVWSVVCHLHAVLDSPALRDAYHKALPKISEYHSEIGQHKGLYDAYLALSKSDAFDDYNTAQKAVIKNALRDFRLSGVDLTQDKQTRYRTLCNELAKLTSQYSDNVLDATQAWTKHIIDKAQLAGLPEYTIAAAKSKAAENDLPGWLLTLDFPCYYSVMMHADDRTLRQTFYQAYCTRASDQGEHNKPFDNSKLMQAILTKRYELAYLLGFEHYAAYSLATKMAESSDDVISFLKQIIDKTKPMAEKELNALRTFAKALDNIGTLSSWDISYYSEKLRQKTYAISEEALRPYFLLDNVFNGLFTIVERLYGIQVVEEKAQAWHDDVKLFALYDDQKQLRGKIYADVFARKNKRSGAWMDECQIRRKHDGNIQIPIAYLVCNFAAPMQDKPSLLTHDDVETLFHEFGHCLHHVLTQIDYSDVSGINGVAWDAVELPSQFMENWAWQKDSLALFALHHETKKPLPESIFANLLKARNFHAAMQMLRQMEFSLFDFQLHLENPTENADLVAQTLKSVRSHVAIMPVPAYNRFAHTFSHIFSGGYAAGYYSYAWADVLAADAFAQFLEQGIFNPTLGQKFLNCILAKGGSEPALDLFIAFCGHKPDVNSLLHARGIG